MVFYITGRVAVSGSARFSFCLIADNHLPDDPDVLLDQRMRLFHSQVVDLRFPVREGYAEDVRILSAEGLDLERFR